MRPTTGDKATGEKATGSAAPGSVPPAFARRIAERLTRLEHMAAGSTGYPGCHDGMTVTEADFSLFLTLAPAPGSTHDTASGEEPGGEAEAMQTLHRARFSGPSGAPENAVLDILCAYAKDIPLRELFEHGLIHVMQELHDPDMAAPVAGILTPRNAGPCFAVPLKLMAALRRQSEERFGPHTGTNFFDRPYSAAWSELDEGGKRALAEKHIGHFRKARNIAADAFTLNRIDRYDRLFVVFADDAAGAIPAADKPALLMEMERRLRRETGERIEIFTEIVRDANRIRRL